MTRTPLLLLFTLACAKSAPTTPAADLPKAPALEVALPDAPGAPAFANLLIANPVTDWSPTDDRSFMYDPLTFSPDGSFTAAASLNAGGESVPCAESGTWSVEDVESRTAGTIEMTVVETDCATRAADHTQRIRLSRESDAYRIAYR